VRGACVLLALVAAPLASPHVPLDDIRFERWGKAPLSILDRAPYFLDRAALLALPVPPPPLNSAPATRAELDELLALQAHRTRAQERAIADHREYASVCDAILGAVHRDLKAAPKTRALLDHVERDASLAIFHAKRRFNRARPDQLEPRLHPSLAVPAHPAYPSGHALQGYLVARVLSAIFPDQLQALAAAGTLIGREREMAGLHYPSDSAASRALGAALFAGLESNPKFLAELAAARSEWR
jgi:acid phosphatase (class A)